MIACLGLLGAAPRLGLSLAASGSGEPSRAAAPAAEASAPERPMRQRLDAPLLFTKRFNDEGIHIYDTYYKWRPGGGIYILENPSAPPGEQKIRPVIDATTPGTLGAGVYNKPNLSWDGKRVVFCYKGAAGGSTCLYEIGIDGTGLRRLTDPSTCLNQYKGSLSGQHDFAPAYLPDGRIVFISTRPSGLVPCFNTGVAILHVMNADGSDIHPISVNNVNEFDPSVLPDGRILFGRWEYVDKTALTVQSLWTIFPDGTNETALFANNMVFPEAVLDARPVPGASPLVAATFAPHNSPPRGSVAFIDPYLGKNDPAAIYNLEHPDKPTHNNGESCEPWPLSTDVVLYSGRPPGKAYNAILSIDRTGRREILCADPEIDLHAPMLVKPRPCPPVLAAETDRTKRTGRFLVQDIYQGLAGVERGEVKWLRVVEETSRVSPTPGGPQPYNQTFLVSCALAFSAKNFLGVVPVEPDGSAYFEVPSGRAVYFQALDGEGRMIRSMRTFVQAAPGVTRSCVGCHEYKYGVPPRTGPAAMGRPPRRLQDESWGSGFLDYPSMVQPVLDERCVSCHGGEKGFGGGLDLAGGWTEHFNISYENLTSRRTTQLTAHLIAGIDCMNGTALWSVPVFAPRAHGSGAAPLAKILVDGHEGRLPDLSRRQRDLVMAWIDSNGLYHGTWDYSKHGCANQAWGGIKAALVREMQAAGCGRCHGEPTAPFEDDWFNLERPELSRILRAPLAQGGQGLGASLCRDRQVDPRRQRVRMLWNGYAHAVQPLEAFKPQTPSPAPADAAAVITFTSTADPHYQNMLEIIRQGRERALAAPRVDMPGAERVAGACRQLVPPPLPDPPPSLAASVDTDGVVHLAWERSARTIGLGAEVHRSAQADFTPDAETKIAATQLFEYGDADAAPGKHHYAVLLESRGECSKPVRADVTVPEPVAPAAPVGLKAVSAPGAVELTWQAPPGARRRYNVYRAEAGAADLKRMTSQPITQAVYSDVEAAAGVRYAYVVRAVSPRGAEGTATEAAVAVPLPQPREPVFAAALARTADAALLAGGAARGTMHGKASMAESALDLRQGGHVTFDHRPEFDLAGTGRLSVECWVEISQETPMPVIVSCGLWQKAGWFIQRLGSGWRWHVGGIDCDGGRPATGRWTHLVGTFDGHVARLFQDGLRVGEKEGEASRAPWDSPLHVGQYSGGPAPSYQVHGRIAGMRIYSRAITANEVKTASQAPPPAQP